MWYAALAQLLRLQDGSFAVRSADYPECEGRSTEAWTARVAFRRSLADRVQELIALGQVPKLYRSPELQAAFPSHCRLQIPASDRAPNTFDFGVIEPVKLSSDAEHRLASLLPPPVGAACKPAETGQGDGGILPAATMHVSAVPPPANVRAQDAALDGKHSSSTSERVHHESGVVRSSPQFPERVSTREPTTAHIDQSLRQQAAILPLRAPPNDDVRDDT